MISQFLDIFFQYVPPQWLDILWLPVLVLVASRGQRMSAALFVICNMVMMRMLIETMQWIGYPRGVMDVLHYGLFLRGLVFFSGVYALYMVYARLTRQGQSAMFMAGTVSAFFIANILFAIVMVL